MTTDTPSTSIEQSIVDLESSIRSAQVQRNQLWEHEQDLKEQLEVAKQRQFEAGLRGVLDEDIRLADEVFRHSPYPGTVVYNRETKSPRVGIGPDWSDGTYDSMRRYVSKLDVDKPSGKMILWLARRLLETMDALTEARETQFPQLEVGPVTQELIDWSTPRIRSEQALRDALGDIEKHLERGTRVVHINTPGASLSAGAPSSPPLPPQGESVWAHDEMPDQPITTRLRPVFSRKLGAWLILHSDMCEPGQTSIVAQLTVTSTPAVDAMYAQAICDRFNEVTR